MHARDAVRYVGDEGEYFTVASMKISLANLLADRAKLANGSEVADIAEAQSLLQSLRMELRDNKEAKELLAYTCNSLGSIFLSSRIFDSNINSNVLLDQALDAFRETLIISEIYSDAENWGAAKANIGRVLAEMANTRDLEEYERNFLRIRAIAEFGAAAETVPIVAYPLIAADIHQSLAHVLVEHAKALDDGMSEIYMFRAGHPH